MGGLGAKRWCKGVISCFYHYLNTCRRPHFRTLAVDGPKHFPGYPDSCVDIAQEATEAINIVDTVASHALVSAFGESNCFVDFDTRQKCNVITENFGDEQNASEQIKWCCTTGAQHAFL